MELSMNYNINYDSNDNRKLCTIYSLRSSFGFCDFDQALSQQIAACNLHTETTSPEGLECNRKFGMCDMGVS